MSDENRLEKSRRMNLVHESKFKITISYSDCLTSLAKVMNPKPLERFVALSIITTESMTSPNCSKNLRKDCSVTVKTTMEEDWTARSEKMQHCKNMMIDLVYRTN